MENMRTAGGAARGPRITQGKSAKDCRPRQAAAALGGRSGWGGTRVALGGRSRATRTGLKATAPGTTGRENREKATWWHTLQSSQQASAAAGASGDGSAAAAAMASRQCTCSPASTCTAATCVSAMCRHRGAKLPAIAWRGSRSISSRMRTRRSKGAARKMHGRIVAGLLAERANRIKVPAARPRIFSP